jgi:hypothetical protein
MTSTFVLAVLFAAIPSTTEAQDRQGFLVGLAGGLGSAGVACDGCSDPRETSGVGSLKAGWWVNRRVAVGGELTLWTKKASVEEDVDLTLNLYNFSATVTVYPKPASGFFAKTGVGVAIIDADVASLGQSVTIDLGQGLGVVAGVGYDLRVARRISITPAVNVWYGRPGSLGQFASNFRYNVVDFTLGIAFD